jgi:hypothetical protein
MITLIDVRGQIKCIVCSNTGIHVHTLICPDEVQLNLMIGLIAAGIGAWLMQ